jgi:hypothetical protein
LRAGEVPRTIGKDLNEDYNFSSNLTLIEDLHKKLWASKVAKVLILRISKLALGHPGSK